MAEQTEKTSWMQSGRVRAIAGAVVVFLVVVVVWFWMTRGHESTDDAQVDARVTQLAARVGGTVLRVAIKDNQEVDEGAVLVEIDPRDYEVALDRARAELANAEAESLAANANVPITSTTTSNTVSAGRGGVERARDDPRREERRENDRRRGAVAAVEHDERHAVAPERREGARDRRVARRPVSAQKRDVVSAQRRAHGARAEGHAFVHLAGQTPVGREVEQYDATAVAQRFERRRGVRKPGELTRGLVRPAHCGRRHRGARRCQATAGDHERERSNTGCERDAPGGAALADRRDDRTEAAERPEA